MIAIMSTQVEESPKIEGPGGSLACLSRHHIHVLMTIS